MRHPDEGTDEAPLNHGRSLGDALAWLDRHINLEAIERGVAGRHARPDLTRITALLEAMDHPERGYPIVHVTGTNGKGSTTRMIAALLEANGVEAGVYTSPNLERLNERIAYAGQPISDAELAGVLSFLEQLEGFLAERGARRGGLDEYPTWFELVTAAGYRYFADVAAQAAVIEVGLGGRYDATNVADAVVAVATNVELDHVKILGPTRADIAREKAGIIKQGAIAVIGEEDPEIVDIFAEEARNVGALALWRRGEDFAVEENRLAVGGRLLDLRTPGATYDSVYLPLHGAHQGRNASAALAAAEAFFGAPLAAEVVAEGFAAVTVPGRLEVLGRHPVVLLDGAHNAHGAEALGAALGEDFAGVGRIVMVMGCLRGHDDPARLIEAIGDERIDLVVACPAPSPRAIPAEVIAEAARGLGYEASIAADVADALRLALAAASPEDLVLVTGSLYVVGNARALLRPRS